MSSQSGSIPSIASFFESFAEALESQSAKVMAHLHLVPTTMLSDDAYTIFSDSSKLEGFFNQGIAFYRQIGIVYVRAEVWSKTELTDRIARVKVLWHYADALKQPVYSCEYTYVLKLDKTNHWKIVLSISIDEKEQMEDWKQGKR